MSGTWVRLLAVVGGACAAAVGFATLGMARETVRGSGKTISEMRPIRGVSRVSLTGSGDLSITQGDTESLKIEAEDNILPLLAARVSGGELVFGFKGKADIRPKKPIRFHLMVKDLSAISISGASDVRCRELRTKSLALRISGAGDITLKVNADDVGCRISGAGNVHLSGTASHQEVSISGTGEYNARDLSGKTAEITIPGVGTARVNVSDELEATVTGIGSIEYVGNPKVRKSITGLGKITQVGD